MKTAAKVGAWKKAKFFAVIPKSAALQNWSHPGWLSPRDSPLESRSPSL